MKKVLLLMLALTLALGLGCAKKTVQTKTEEPAPAPKAEVVQPKQEPVVQKAPTPRELYEQMYAGLPTSYTVVKGDCLWNISKKDKIYNDPFMWPLIYKANRDKIKDPHWIYPKQVFAVERAMTLDDVKAARVKAGKSKKSAAPTDKALIPADIRAQLGYSF